MLQHHFHVGLCPLQLIESLYDSFDVLAACRLFRDSRRSRIVSRFDRRICNRSGKHKRKSRRHSRCPDMRASTRRVKCMVIAKMRYRADVANTALVRTACPLVPATGRAAWNRR